MVKRVKLGRSAPKPTTKSAKAAAKPTKPSSKVTVKLRPATLAEKMAVLVERHSPTDIFDACTVLLAANDVINGDPHWTLAHGFDKIHDDVTDLSHITREFMAATGKLPSMFDIIHLRHAREQREACEFRRHMN